MKAWRNWIGAAALLGCLCAVGCGGGGDGENGGAPPTLLAVYQWSLENVMGGQPMVLAFEQDGDDLKVTVAIGAQRPTGLYNRIADSWTVDPGGVWLIDTNAGPDDLVGLLTVTVTETIGIPADDSPQTGAFMVEHAGDDVEVTFVAGGVQLSVDGGPATFYDWETFDELTEQPGSTLEEVAASFANQVLFFMFERYWNVVELLLEIDDEFEFINPRFTEESAFPAGWDIPDELQDPAWNTIMWYDNGPEGVGTSDDFDVGLGDWPLGEDSLGRGQVQFQNYLESIDGANRVVQAGFGMLGRPGGILWDGLDMVQLEEDSGVVSIFSILQLDGGFAMLFEED